MFTTPEPFNTAGYDENQEKTYLNLTTDLENRAAPKAEGDESGDPWD